MHLAAHFEILDRVERVEVDCRDASGHVRLAETARYGADCLNRFSGQDIAGDGSAETYGWPAMPRSRSRPKSPSSSTP